MNPKKERKRRSKEIKTNPFEIYFPGGASGKVPACQCRRQSLGWLGCRFDPCFGKIPWRRAWQPTPVFLPGESHGQRSLGATVLAKSRTELKQLSMRTDKIIVTFWCTYFPEWRYTESYCVLFKGLLLSIQNAI